MWAGQKGLKALTAALKKNENKFIKNDIKIRYKYTTQDTNYRPTRYWEKSLELIDRLQLASEVESTALDGNCSKYQ